MALPTTFSFVTVMNVKVFEIGDTPSNGPWTRGSEIGEMKCLTISNISQEGPRKEIRGGLHAKPCVRYGKTMRLEMEDAVARPELFKELFGADVSMGLGPDTGEIAITNEFAKPVRIEGITEIVKEDGDVEDVEIIFYKFLPDSITDFTMEAEGDIGVVNIAGELFPGQDRKFFTISSEVTE